MIQLNSLSRWIINDRLNVALARVSPIHRQVGSLFLPKYLAFREVGCKLDQESAAPMQAAAAVMEVTMSLDEPSAAASRVEVANDVDEESLAEVMRVVPLGAGVLAGSAVALLVLGYLAIYLLVFLPRGTVG
jgi:hypothetical protein